MKIDRRSSFEIPEIRSAAGVSETQLNKFKKQLETLYDTYIVNMWKWKERVVPVKMDGRKAMKLLSELGIKPDLIYLDMDHSYESAKGDLVMLMKYFPDTLIFLRTYTSILSGVTKLPIIRRFMA